MEKGEEETSNVTELPAPEMSSLDHLDTVGNGENVDDTDGCFVSEEEEMLVRLFHPRTSSIGSEGDVASSCPHENDGIATGARESPSLDPAEDKSICTYGSAPFMSLGNTERQLKSAEKSYLGQTYVRSGNVPLSEISDRFRKTSMPSNPLAGGEGHVNKYMEGLVQSTVEDAVNTASPSMVGHMTSSLPYFMRPLSRLVTTMNQNVVKTETGNTVTFMEREAMAQLHKQIYDREQNFYDRFAQDPSTVLGVLTSGGTLANVTAMWAARNIALKPRGSFEGVENEGLFSALMHYGYTGGAAIIGSELLHYSLGKSVDVLGLGAKSLISVPVGEDFRVRLDLMRAALEDCEKCRVLVVAVVGVAGATETGSIDDLEGIAELAAHYGTFFHVDAAWGGPLIFSRKYKHLLKGIELADSVTLDGHKQLYMPMGCGLCFFKNPETSLAVRKTAQYIIRKDSHDLGRFTLEGSRPANAVYLHSNLNIFGIRGYEVLVDRSIRIVAHMAKRIQESNGWFQLVSKPTSNILLYRCIPPHLHSSGNNIGICANKEIDSLNIEVQRLQTLQGRTFVSRTNVLSPIYCTQIVALRVVIANPLTFEADVDRVLQNQVGILVHMLGIDVLDVPEPLRPEENGEIENTRSVVSSCDRKLSTPIQATGTSFADKQQTESACEGTSDSEKSHAFDNKYWLDYWLSMPQPLRNLFKNNSELFLSSLVAPELQLENEDGLFSAKRMIH